MLSLEKYDNKYNISKDLYFFLEERYGNLWDLPVKLSVSSGGYVTHVISAYMEYEENNKEEYTIKIHRQIYSEFDPVERISITKEHNWYRSALIWIKFI